LRIFLARTQAYPHHTILCEHQRTDCKSSSSSFSWWYYEVLLPTVLPLCLFILLKNNTPPLPLHLGRKAANHVAQHRHQIHHHWQSSLPLSIRRRHRNHEAKKHRPSGDSSSSSSSSSARCSIVGESSGTTTTTTTTTTTGNVVVVVVVGPCRKNGLDCTFVIDTTTNLFHHLLVVCRTRSHIVWTISANNGGAHDPHNASRCPAPRRHSRHGQRLGTSHLRTRRQRHF
jgi:predicted  nucleic acid-binding Zn ribbon protein